MTGADGELPEGMSPELAALIDDLIAHDLSGCLDCARFVRMVNAGARPMAVLHERCLTGSDLLRRSWAMAWTGDNGL